MSTATYTLGEAGDCSRERSDTTTVTNDATYTVNYSGTPTRFFLRFGGSGVGALATINSAYIITKAYASFTGNDTVTFTGQGTKISNSTYESPATMGTSTTTLLISRRMGLSSPTYNGTSATVNWTCPAVTNGSTYNTSELKSIIQEIVNYSGYADGQTFALISYINSGGGNKYLGGWSVGTKPTLYIDYTNYVPPPPVIPAYTDVQSKNQSFWIM